MASHNKKASGSKKIAKRAGKSTGVTRITYDNSPPLYYGRMHAHVQANIRRTAQSAETTAGVRSATGAGANMMALSPLYYDYRWSTPDKFYFPRSRAVANRIWREVYMRDAAIAAATDMYAELPWSKFDLIGLDDPAIRKVYEDQFNELDLVPKLQNFTRDYYITGELILHAVLNSRRGIWERVISHNPDYVEVKGLGLAFEQPLLWLRPTPEIRSLINSPDPRVREFHKLIPREILNAFRMNRKVSLDSLNTTYIPRLQNSYNVRGTSLYTRLFRVLMYEDFIVNASLAVAQRNAAPLRIFKLGDPDTHWVPSPEVEQQFIEMLAMAEADPMAAIVMHHNVSAELVGVSDRVLLISREWDFIERVKLLAMGVAKSFLVGETSFASSIAGMQMLLERLSALRYKFEQEWIIKKLCKPIAEIHKFYKRKPNELEHRIRIERPEERTPIVPQLKWHKSLEPVQDVSVLGVWDRLYEYGLLSERTYTAGAGIDLEVERKNMLEELRYEEEKKSKLEELGIEMEEPGEAGGAGGLPPPSGASFKRHKKISRRDRPARYNPYDEEPSREEKLEQLERVKAEQMRDDSLGNLELELENLADKDNRVHIDDVIEVVSNGSHNDGRINNRKRKASKRKVTKKEAKMDRMLSVAERQFDIPPAQADLLL